MAKRQKELNTSCRATFKDGHTEEFSSIEEASEKTGLTVASIKIRCNKKGCGGKDKTTFEWLDEHTKRSYQAKKSRNKGSAWELEIVHKLNEIGFEVKNARGESKFLDNSKIDIADMRGDLPCNIQAKHLANTPSYFAIRDACPDKEKPFCVLWKQSSTGEGNSKGSIAMIPTDFFFELLQQYLNK